MLSIEHGSRSEEQERRDRLLEYPFLVPNEEAQRWCAALRSGFTLREHAAEFEQVPPLAMLVGGTNVGKSWIFNSLLGAEVSSEAVTAEHTRHVVCSFPALPGLERTLRDCPKLRKGDSSG